MRDDGHVASGWAELGISETNEGAVRMIELKREKFDKP